jgi:hypothetical protein
MRRVGPSSFAVRRIAVIKVRRRRNETFLRHHVREFKKIIDAGLSLHDNHRQRWPRILRLAEVDSHLRVIDVYVFPG